MLQRIFKVLEKTLLVTSIAQIVRRKSFAYFLYNSIKYGAACLLPLYIRQDSKEKEGFGHLGVDDPTRGTEVNVRIFPLDQMFPSL